MSRVGMSDDNYDIRTLAIFQVVSMSTGTYIQHALAHLFRSEDRIDLVSRFD
jgi:hypothetical protein